MTNPLLKVTLIILSLISAVFVGQVLLGSAHTSPAHVQGLPVNLAPSAQALSQPLAKPNAEQTTESGVRSQSTDTGPASDAAPAAPRQSSTQNRGRSFSFHYLDILEWLFAGRGEKAKHHQPQRPSTTLSVW